MGSLLNRLPILVDKVDNCKMVYRYALRVDLDGVDAAVIVALIAKFAIAYLVVRETVDGDNPHVHAFFTSESKIAGIRKAVQRFLSGDRGNAGYSLKECAPEYDDYLTYLCKGNSSSEMPEVVGKLGLDFTDEWVKDRHSQYYVNREAIIGQRQKRKKITTATAVEKLEERCKEAGIAWNQKNDIAREYIRMCKVGRKAINVFSARSIVNAVTVALCPDERAEVELAALIAPAECFNF